MKFIRPGKHLEEREVAIRNILLLVEDLTQQRDMVHKALILDEPSLIQASIQQRQEQATTHYHHIDILRTEIDHEIYDVYISYLRKQKDIFSTYIDESGQLSISHKKLLEMLHTDLTTLRDNIRSETSQYIK